MMSLEVVRQEQYQGVKPPAYASCILHWETSVWTAVKVKYGRCWREERIHFLASNLFSVVD